jgi:glyoxylase-like metal-dependent hydrolase (beta-lactamase superfamily II)
MSVRVLWLRIVAVACVAFATQVVPVAAQATVGASLPRWTPGTLDIHQISTGRGNSALVVFPDGTSLLVDAGATGSGVAPETEPHPDSSRTPGEWIARYVKRHLPDSAAGLDYAMLTHLHIDHMGHIVATSPLDSTGAYRLSGITGGGHATPHRHAYRSGLARLPVSDADRRRHRRELPRVHRGTAATRPSRGAVPQWRARPDPAAARASAVR